mmetsp:Transcript_4186/g.17688  ORF Transcript_4186/g.17688 Transcript_4186/m.17688 type:complete len:389 (-) Transcript_4186:2761-3927(-)
MLLVRFGAATLPMARGGCQDCSLHRRPPGLRLAIPPVCSQQLRRANVAEKGLGYAHCRGKRSVASLELSKEHSAREGAEGATQREVLAGKAEERAFAHACCARDSHSGAARCAARCPGCDALGAQQPGQQVACLHAAATKGKAVRNHRRQAPTARGEVSPKVLKHSRWNNEKTVGKRCPAHQRSGQPRDHCPSSVVGLFSGGSAGHQRSGAPHRPKGCRWGRVHGAAPVRGSARALRTAFMPWIKSCGEPGCSRSHGGTPGRCESGKVGPDPQLCRELPHKRQLGLCGPRTSGAARRRSKNGTVMVLRSRTAAVEHPVICVVCSCVAPLVKPLDEPILDPLESVRLLHAREQREDMLLLLPRRLRKRRHGGDTPSRERKRRGDVCPIG